MVWAIAPGCSSIMLFYYVYVDSAVTMMSRGLLRLGDTFVVGLVISL
jgi:hypothetical protein